MAISVLAVREEWGKGGLTDAARSLPKYGYFFWSCGFLIAEGSSREEAESLSLPFQRASLALLRPKRDERTPLNLRRPHSVDITTSLSGEITGPYCYYDWLKALDHEMVDSNSDQRQTRAIQGRQYLA